MSVGLTATRQTGARTPRRSAVGDLRRLRADPLGLFTEAAAGGEDVVAFRAAHLRVFLAVGPEAIARVTIANRANYRKGVSYDALRIPIGDSLLTADGDLARDRRRLLGPLFTRRAVQHAVPVMTAAIDDCAARWEALDGQVVDLVPEMNRLAFDIVGRVLLGAELGAAMTQLGALIDDASDWVARRTRALVPLSPRLPTPRNRAYRRAEIDIRAFTERVIAERRSAGGDDMLSRLLHAHGGALTDREVRDEIIGFLMAGHQTMGAALAWSWHLLGRHPDALARLRDDGDVYAGKVVQETMRLYPPGWAFTRTPVKADTLAGRDVPAGSIVVICAYANQRSPRFWADPSAFDPGRFDDHAPAPEQHAYFPFGHGPHACIGRNLALVEAKLALTRLAARFDLEPLSQGQIPAEPGITLTPGAPMLARVVRR